MENFKCNNKYNVVQWESVPHTIQKVQYKKRLSVGDLVVNPTKFNTISNANSWFNTRNVKKAVKMNNAVHASIKMNKKLSFTNMKKRIFHQEKYPMKTDNGYHKTILNAIFEREHIMFKI